jgi:hypothetical protein
MVVAMYAAAYRRPEGFGSVGFLGDILPGRALVADPIFGSTWVQEEDFFCVIETEEGAILPGTAPTLIPSQFSEHLMEAEVLAANEAEVMMLRPRKGGEEFPSGYPVAWEYIERWRTGVAADWRTIALAAIFARTSIQRPIKHAEKLYRLFGHTIRDAYLAGRSPTADEMIEYAGLKGSRAETARLKKRGGPFDDAAVYEEIGEWASWVAAAVAPSDDYSRDVRDMIAIEWLPKGLGIAKVSFTMMLAGRDAACLDTRMLDYFFAKRKKSRTDFEKAVARRSTMKGARGITQSAVKRYRKLEDKLSKTPYFDPEWLMPFAKAQWMLWETLGRTPGTADHSALWEVIEPLIAEIDAG